MSRAVIKAYQTWANEMCDGKKNTMACREAGLEPWEVFKFTYEQGQMGWTISENYLEVLKQEDIDKNSVPYINIEENKPQEEIIQEITDEERTEDRRSEKPSTTNDSSSVGKRSKRKGRK